MRRRVRGEKGGGVLLVEGLLGGWKGVDRGELWFGGEGKGKGWVLEMGMKMEEMRWVGKEEEVMVWILRDVWK